jgi:solute carrier family 25 citrate transporter 1
MEAIIAVTPSETIKYDFTSLSSYSSSELTISCRTKLIDDAKRPVPQYRGLVHGAAQIVKAEGLRGIYRGLFPVVRPIRVVSGSPAH